MATNAVSIADQIVTAINAGSYSNSFSPTAARYLVGNRSVENLEDSKSLSVAVVPFGLSDVEFQSASRLIETYQTTIHIRSNVGKDSNSNTFTVTEIENLLQFVGEVQTQICEWEKDRTDFELIRYENPALYDPELIQKGQFHSIVLIESSKEKDLS